MQQNINYQGMQTQPSDHDTPDGPMHLALNLEQRSGAYHAARIPTEEEFYIENFTPLFIHNPSSDNSTDNIVIGAYYKDTEGAGWDYKLKAYYYTKQSNNYKEITINSNKGLGTNYISDFDNFCNIGNIVCFTILGKVSYLCYINSSYNAISGNPPEIKPNYYILRKNPLKINSNTSLVQPDEETYLNNNMIPVADDKVLDKNGLPSYINETRYSIRGLFLNASVDNEYATEYSILHKCEKENTKIEDSILGTFNVLRTHLEKEGYLLFPVFVVCAYRLYDGSTIMVTDPVLTYPIDTRPQLFYKDFKNYNDIDLDKSLPIALYSEAYQIFVDIKIDESYKNWCNIISSIDFFISAPLYNIETDKIEYSNGNKMSLTNKVIFDLKQRNGKEVIENVDSFYLVKSVPFEKIPTLNKTLDLRKYNAALTEDQLILPHDITNYTQSERLKINSFNRFNIYAKSLCNNNNRLSISNIKKVLNPDSLSHFPKITYLNRKVINNEGKNVYSVSSTLPIMTDIKSKEKIEEFNLKEIEIVGVYVKDIGNVLFAHSVKSNNFFLSFYDSKITKIIVKKDSNYYYQNLSQNTIAGFSYYIRNNTYEDCSIPVKNNDYEECLPSLIKASEVNNPFVFKDGNSAECGIGKIITIASNARAVSQGQFGQYPIFAFCTDGIYAVGVGTDGTLQNCNPYTYDIITSPLSVCNIQTSLAYITRSGIHIIGNDGPQEILSFNQEDNYNFDNDQQKNFINKHFTNLPTIVTPYTYFTQGAHITYDYPNQRIIVYNPTYTYTYIYSIPSQSWSIILQSYDNHLNTYSKSLLVKGNKIYNLSSDTIQDKLNGLLITRPIKLESPDVHKTIQAIIQRGNFPSGAIAQALYASNDAINWLPIWSSQTERLRPIRGTAYKYYRLVIFLTDFKQEHTLSGCTIDYLPKLTNKIR